MRKKFWKIVVMAVAVLASPLIAGKVLAGNDSCFVSCDPCAPIGCAKKSKLKVGGWLEASYYRNAWGQENVYQTGADRFYPDRNMITAQSGNTAALGNMHNADFQMNQAWVFIEREMDTRNGFDWGFRADFGYGTDMWIGQAWNNREFDYDWGEGDYFGAIPRLYASAGYKNLGVKFGRFDSLLDYEAVDAPEKFFISHSYAYYGTAPYNTGILADYKLGKRLTLYAGWTMGNQNGFENRFGDSLFTGGVKFDLAKKMSLSYMFETGYMYDGTYGGPRQDYTVFNGPMGADRYDTYSQTINFKWNATKRFTYVLQSDYLQGEFEDGYAIQTAIAKRYGVNNHFIYQLNKKWSLGFRAEWYRQEFGLDGSAMNGVDVYEYTLALQWKPLKRLTLTGEIRYDEAWGDNGHFDAFNNGQNNEQFSGGISAILHF